MKILVTAFKPFNNFANNYSMEVLKFINNVDKIILDVVYDECYNELITSYDLSEYDLVIAMGEARSRKELTLETQAVNISSCSLVDNNGVLKQNKVIINEEDMFLKTKVNLEKVKEFVILSYDAGKFVCNNLYFHLLSDYPEKSIFVHIPDCNNELTKYNEYAKIIEKIITNII